MIEFERKYTFPAKLLALLVPLGALVVSCSKEQNGTGNTNWYLECDTAAECGGQGSCQCGYCTPECEGTLDCSLSPDRHCTTDPGTGRTTDPVQAGSDTDDAATGDSTTEPFEGTPNGDANTPDGDTGSEPTEGTPNDDATPGPTEGLPNDERTENDAPQEQLTEDAAAPSDTPTTDAGANEPIPNDHPSSPDASIGDVPCAERSVDECTLDAECGVLAAYPAGDDGTCYDESNSPVLVGCMIASGGCIAALQAGVDPDGNCWRLISCMPAHFRRPEPDECPGVLEVCD